TTSLEKRDGEVSCGAGKKLVVSSSDQQASGHPVDGSVKCIDGIWKGTLLNSEQFKSRDVYATCMATDCNDPAKSDDICTTPSCNKDTVIINEEVTSISCPNGNDLYVKTSTTTVTVTGSVTCVDGVWTGKNENNVDFHEETITVTCEAPCSKVTKTDVCLDDPAVCDKEDVDYKESKSVECKTDGFILLVGGKTSEGLTCKSGTWIGTVDGNADFESTDDLTVTCLDGRCTTPHDGTNICTAKQSCSTTSLEKRDGEVS
ncbi:hypothetical protein PFISCL1PPCAC_26534, partial [Pristionchus fissidentatus]